MKDQPIPAEQLQSRAIEFDVHGRRKAAHDAPTAALTGHTSAPSSAAAHQPTGNRGGRKRPAGEVQDTRGQAQIPQQAAPSLAYNPNLVKRQRRESPPAAAGTGDYYNGHGSVGRSSPDRAADPDYRGRSGNNGRRGGEREWGSPTRSMHRGGRGGGRNEGGDSRNQLPPAPRSHGRGRDSRPERTGYQGQQQQQHQARRGQSNKPDQKNWQYSSSNPPLPPPPRVNSSSASASAPGGASSPSLRIDPQRLPIPLLPSRPLQGPPGSAADALPPKPIDTAACQPPSRPARSPSASSASCSIFSDSDDDGVVETTRGSDRLATLSSLFADRDEEPSPRVELQYKQPRLSAASSASASTQFNRRSSPASGSAAAAPPAPPTRSGCAASAGVSLPPPLPARAHTFATSFATGAATSRTALTIAFPEINYPSYSAASSSASAAASGSRRASIDDDDAPDAQLRAAMSEQHQRYVDLATRLGELDDRSFDLDKQIATLIAAKKEVDAERRDLTQQLRTALDHDPVLTAGPLERPPLPPTPSAAPTPPAVPRQTAPAPATRGAATSAASSSSRSGPPAPGAASASGANATPSLLTVTRTAMADKITTRKPRALAYHPQPESDLVVAAFMDGGIRLFDTSRRSCTLLHYCPIEAIDPANPGKPDTSPRIEAMRFVGNNHLVAVHLKSTEGAPMSMVTVDRQANGARALSTKHHLFGISLYDRETSAVASDRDPSTYRFATAGKGEKEGWRVHLWSLRQPIEAANDDGRYPYVLQPTDHFQTYLMPAAHTSHIHSMILDDNNLFTSGFDGRLQWIDLTVQQPKWQAQLKGKKVTQILRSPADPHLLYVACADSSAQFRAIDLRLAGSNTEPVSQMQFGYNMGDANLSSTLMSAVDTHTGRHFVSGSPLSDQKGTVLTWDLRYISSRPTATYFEPTQEMQLGHSSRVEVVQFSPHSHSMATLGIDYRLGLHALA